MALRIFHLCRPHYDNLGEIAANESIAPMFARRGIDVEIISHDIWQQRRENRFLDETLEEIQTRCDLVMIGPGGFLGPKMIGSIFKDPESWSKIQVPLCINGAGLVASATWPVWYSNLDQDSHAFHALNRADAVSVRELNSWLLASRAMNGGGDRLTLAGCPSIRIAWRDPAPIKTYDLALDLPFTHEVCRQHIALLSKIAQVLRVFGKKLLWVCHSRADFDVANGVKDRFDLGFDIVRPANAQEAGEAYGACKMAIVTRFHAGIFCLANQVPFGFIGYDMKCWNLMTMLADEPYHYVLPIDRLAVTDVESEIDRLLNRLTANAEHLRTAQQLLVAHFDRQTDRFVDTVLAAVARRQGCSAIVTQHTADEMTG